MYVVVFTSSEISHKTILIDDSMFDKDSFEVLAYGASGFFNYVVQLAEKRF
jgi:hypothetical protein